VRARALGLAFVLVVGLSGCGVRPTGLVNAGEAPGGLQAMVNVYLVATEAVIPPASTAQPARTAQPASTAQPARTAQPASSAKVALSQPQNLRVGQLYAAYRPGIKSMDQILKALFLGPTPPEADLGIGTRLTGVGYVGYSVQADRVTVRIDHRIDELPKPAIEQITCTVERFPGPTPFTVAVTDGVHTTSAGTCPAPVH
jgi:hypothetical protein